MCFLWSTNWGFISQKAELFIVTTVKNLKSYKLEETGADWPFKQVPKIM
jgi:hypothetical protein